MSKAGKKLIAAAKQAVTVAGCDHVFTLTPKQPRDGRMTRAYCARCETTFTVHTGRDAPVADSKQEVLIDYTNWRGERRWRRVRPLSIQFENSEWHHDTQWIMHAVDCEAGATREFAMKDIHEWKRLNQ